MSSNEIHIVNGDAIRLLIVPNGYSILHHNDEQVEWSLDKISLYTCDEQKDGSISGSALRKKLEGQPVLNASVLQYLLANTHLIPEEWRDKKICFWGTLYLDDAHHELYVPCLMWIDEKWLCPHIFLGKFFHEDEPAIILCK